MMGQMGGVWPQAGGGAAGHGHCTCPSVHANCKACMHGLAAHLIAGAFGYCYSCNGQLPTAAANQEASGPAYNVNAGNQGSAWAPQEGHWGTSQSTYGVQPRGNAPGSAEEGTGAPHFGDMPNGETPLVSEELVAIFAAGKQRRAASAAAKRPGPRTAAEEEAESDAKELRRVELRKKNWRSDLEVVKPVVGSLHAEENAELARQLGLGNDPREMMFGEDIDRIEALEKKLDRSFDDELVRNSDAKGIPPTWPETPM